MNFVFYKLQGYQKWNKMAAFQWEKYHFRQYLSHFFNNTIIYYIYRYENGVFKYHGGNLEEIFFTCHIHRDDNLQIDKMWIKIYNFQHRVIISRYKCMLHSSWSLQIILAP